MKEVFPRQPEAWAFIRSITDPTERLLTELAATHALSFLATDPAYEREWADAPMDLLNFARAANAFLRKGPLLRDVLTGAITGVDDLDPFGSPKFSEAKPRASRPLSEPLFERLRAIVLAATESVPPAIGEQKDLVPIEQTEDGWYCLLSGGQVVHTNPVGADRKLVAGIKPTTAFVGSLAQRFPLATWFLPRSNTAAPCRACGGTGRIPSLPESSIPILCECGGLGWVPTSTTAPFVQGDGGVIHRFNIMALIRDRSAQTSFHVAAEKHVRIEYRNLTEGQTIGPFTYDGDVVVTCYRGAFAIKSGATVVGLGAFDQAVVPTGRRTTLVCEAPGTIQMIWSAPQAVTEQV